MRVLSGLLAVACSSGLTGPDAFEPSSAYVLPGTEANSTRVLLSASGELTSDCTAEWEEGTREAYEADRARLDQGEGCALLAEPIQAGVTRVYGGNPELQLGLFDDGRSAGMLTVCGAVSIGDQPGPWGFVPYQGTASLDPVDADTVRVVLDLITPGVKGSLGLTGSLEAVLCEGEDPTALD